VKSALYSQFVCSGTKSAASFPNEAESALRGNTWFSGAPYDPDGDSSLPRITGPEE
jgi:hypothetical protein